MVPGSLPGWNLCMVQIRQRLAGIATPGMKMRKLALWNSKIVQNSATLVPNVDLTFIKFYVSQFFAQNTEFFEGESAYLVKRGFSFLPLGGWNLVCKHFLTF